MYSNRHNGSGIAFSDAIIKKILKISSVVFYLKYDKYNYFIKRKSKIFPKSMGIGNFFATTVFLYIKNEEFFCIMHKIAPNFGCIIQ